AVLLILGLMLPALAFAQTPPAAPEILLRLPRDLSPWGMFMAADIVVKAVMIGLVFASVLTWTIWFAKAIELMAARRRMGAAAEALPPTGVKERIASRLERVEAAAGRQMIRGTGLLATIGATAPFVGLFGTVWGIMNSFIGISKVQTTNLAVVAPGI